MTLCLTFCFASNEATVSVKADRSEPYTVLVVWSISTHKFNMKYVSLWLGELCNTKLTHNVRKEAMLFLGIG